MNIENLTLLAETLESVEAEDHFYIGSWFSARADVGTGADANDFLKGCGTTACIGGWAGALMGRTSPSINPWSDDTIRDWMGFPYVGSYEHDMYWDLCYGYQDPEVTSKQAARVIRNLIATGKVDWTILNDEAVS